MDKKRRVESWVVTNEFWLNRFRKLLVRYQKPERSYLALNHLAAAIIALRKIPAKINPIYG